MGSALLANVTLGWTSGGFSKLGRVSTRLFSGVTVSMRLVAVFGEEIFDGELAVRPWPHRH